MDPNSNVDTTIVHQVFTECRISIEDDGTLTVRWNNGEALNAVTGASIDYIPPEFKLCVVKSSDNKLSYDFITQYNRLVDAKVDQRLAYLVCLHRATLMSWSDAVYNFAELHISMTAPTSLRVDRIVREMVQKHAPVINNLIQQTFTLAALAGISMVSTGHHYSSEDGVWKRFEASTNYETSMTTLGIVNWEGAIYHHLMHPLEVHWLSKMVAKEISFFSGKTNGVATKRMPAMPAGSMKLSVIKAFVDYVRVAHPTAYDQFAEFSATIDALIVEVKNAPLEWSSSFRTAKTAVNLARVDALVPVGCILYGMIEQISAGGRKPSVLKSKAFSNAVRNHPEYQLMGRRYVEANPTPEMDPAAIRLAIEAALRAARPV